MLISDAVSDTRRYVYGSAADQVTLLGADYTAGSDEVMIDMTMGTDGISKGSVITIGLNVLFVKGGTTDSSGIVYVIPGYSGSPQENASAGAFVWIKPRATDWQIFSYVNDVIGQISARTAGLYRTGSWEAYTDPVWQTYEIPDDTPVMGILAVRALYPGSTDTWVDVPMSSVQWQPIDNTVRLTYNVTPTTIQFIYRAGFTKAVSLSNDLETYCGLSATMTDIPALGAAVTLLRATENRRESISVQGDPRRAAEVQAGSNTAAANALNRDFMARLSDEYIRLVNQYPVQLGV